MYTYQPLPPVSKTGRTPPFTRILTLFPFTSPPSASPDDSEPFHGTLTVTNLESTQPYEALSYTWGTADPETYIWLDELPLPIKPSLAAALYFLRPPPGHPPRRLWIDALCIDQSSLEERSRQVQYMRLVYKYCKRVVAWIGLKRESDATEVAFEAGKVLSDVSRLVADLRKDAAAGTDDGVVRDVIANALAGLPEGALGNLQRLFDREYFHRTWVVQEIAVANVAVVKCEELEMSFFDLVSTLLFVFGNRGHIDTTTSLDVWYLIFARQSGAHSGHVRLTDIPGSLGPLIDLLEQMRAFKATDLRDKIYSVLGICDEGLQPIITRTHIARRSDRWLRGLTTAITGIQNFVNEHNPNLSWGIPAALKPDYTRPVPEVYTDLARFLISKMPMFLDVLSFVQHRTPPSPDDPYPSWVPKWFESKSITVFRGGDFTAGICTPPLGDFLQSRIHRAFSSPIPNTLIMDGFHVGIVHRVSNIMTFASDGHSKTEAVQRAWAELLPNIPFAGANGSRYITGEPLNVAFCKALSVHPMGAVIGHVMSDSVDGFHFSASAGQMNRQIATGLGDAAVGAFLAGLAGDGGEGIISAETFLTREGRLGIGPTVMQEGDEVVVLFRGRIPYVLRRGQSHHLFMGDCYVRDDNIMCGRLTESVRHGRGGPPAVLYEIR
ncbi:heterokaryon incompatibility protein-domain-containing protein [Triangularia setosa]|uniref:Heterokaryon incompatibility protein-domain-containing protein n=1 Tax=Triangularia setosa TaxID=2587417 RepID=A0AAN6VZB9_9PEZI|nr:heterokaryon incompatibility protein-domain-containing protein [Podospora setosa]